MQWVMLYCLGYDNASYSTCAYFITAGYAVLKPAFQNNAKVVVNGEHIGSVKDNWSRTSQMGFTLCVDTCKMTVD